MTCDLLPLDKLAIIICDSTVVHNQNIYTNRQRTTIVFPVNSMILAQWIEATAITLSNSLIH